MTREMEVKILNIDLEEIENDLIGIGAKLISEEYQKNTIFDNENLSLEKEKNSYLRIREVRNQLTGEDSVELTLKENTNREGLRENIENTTKIDNIESMIYILDKLGYKVREEGEKYRKSYLYENIRFDLDKWDEKTYPHPYMEIEVKDPEDLEKAIKLLNINKDNISTKSIVELKNNCNQNSNYE